jgi:ubiquitin-conjugating enzyme E2 R
LFVYICLLSPLLEQVDASKKDIPIGFKMPESEQDFMPTAPPEIEEDDNL